MSHELFDEGLAREFVRRVQALRKDSELEISDRIRLYFSASAGLTTAVKAFEDYIKAETLCVELLQKPAPKHWPTAKDEFDQETLKISLQKAE